MLPEIVQRGCQEVARRYGKGEIGAHRAVVLDGDNARAQRFEFMGRGVRYPRRGDTAIFGVSVDRIEAPDDLDAPAASGLDASRVVCSGFAWLEIVGPVVGTQDNWGRLDVAVDGDPLGVILDGASVGCARRLEPGDLRIGAAIYVEGHRPLALVRLSRPMPPRSAAGGIF